MKYYFRILLCGIKSSAATVSGCYYCITSVAGFSGTTWLKIKNPQIQNQTMTINMSYNNEIPKSTNKTVYGYIVSKLNLQKKILKTVNVIFYNIYLHADTVVNTHKAEYY